MPLIKYGTVPSHRHNIYKQLELIKDLAVLDFSGEGHALYNEGHNSLLHIMRHEDSNLFSMPLTDAEIATYNTSRLFSKIEEIVSRGYRHLFLMPSAIAKLINFDYQNLSSQIENKYDIRVYHSPTTDCLNIFEQFLNNLDAKGKTNEKKGFVILASIFSYESKRDARYVRDFIEKNYNEECVFTNVERFELKDLLKIYKSKLIVTLDEKFDSFISQILEEEKIKTISANYLDLKSEEKLISTLNNIFNKNLDVRYRDEYCIATAQFKNVLNFNKKKIVVFLEENLDDRLLRFFRSLDIEVEVYCPYKNQKFPMLTIDEFIDKYRETGNSVIISYDRVVKYLKRGLSYESLGLDYYLLTPRPSDRVMLNGAFNIMEDIINEVWL